ncbi:MAG UNVERIFIED_CONTAM: OmpA family protein [Rickettsiaceae bacterium]|jgi:chemotaxis protein MotB
MANKKHSIISKNIIVYNKRDKKRSAQVHHSGMWKVAYADFITAMMCFFLLMWLISTTPTDKLEGIAKYFATKSSKFSGTGTVDGKNKAIAPKSQPKQLLQSSMGEQVFESDKASLLTAEEKQSFINTMNDIRQDKVLREFSENIIWDISSEGLRIQITDTNNRPMFKPDTSELAPYMVEILNAVGRMISGYPNYIAIAGHTASVQENDIMNSSLDYWKLSALRANEVRKFLSPKLKENQVVRIIGKSNTEPIDPKDPFDSQNARISITLLSNTSVSKFQQSLPDNTKFGN